MTSILRFASAFYSGLPNNCGRKAKVINHAIIMSVSILTLESI
jgi:hypothetical protein